MTERKLKRNQTVHYKPLCPDCKKSNVKYYKEFKTAYTNAVHDIYYCKSCNRKWSYEDLNRAVEEMKKEEENKNV